MNSSERARIIRERVVADQAALKGSKRFDRARDAMIMQELAGIESQQLLAGRWCQERLRRLEFQIDDVELLAGRILQKRYAEGEETRADALLQTLPPCGGQTGHCALHFDELFNLGLDGLLAKIERLLDGSSGDSAEAYQSFIYALLGLQEMIGNAMKPVNEALMTATPDRQVELREILDSCQRIQHAPPQTFRDAMQLMWFVNMGVEAGDNVVLMSPGMADRLLARFIDESDGFESMSLELIEAYYFLINDFCAGGLAYAVMVGGVDADGRDVTNCLSYLFLEAIRRTNLVYPTVGVCWHDKTPDDLTALTTELIAAGHTTPAFFGDEVIRNGLMQYGVPAAEACEYINSACVEITPVGTSNIWVASPYFSLCAVLLELLDNSTSFDSCSELLEAYFNLLGKKIAAGVANQNRLREQRRLNGRKPLQSVFTNDCVDRGRDIDDGGARYNWVECSFVGLANLVDSLHVIQEEVFNSGTMTLEELKSELDRNFADNEPLRQKLLNHYPKYGLNNAAVDAQIDQLMEFIRDECAKFSMLPDDAHFVPGTFCWIMHQRLGAECGATPDGRKAGFPFADGAGPAQGREILGPTAAINSVTSWDHTPMIGGSAFNMKFNKTIFKDPGSLEKLKLLVLTFLRQGGFETQINVVDNETLQKALTSPDDYSDLVVRIGGYTDYFTRLSPQMQQEVLLRTEYETV